MARTPKSVVYIGGASGSLVDSAIAVPQLLRAAKLDYLIYDYLAEGSMGIFGKLIAANPAGGFAADFADLQVAPCLAQIKARGIRLITNAGALNPRGLAAEIARRAEALGLEVRIAVVEGDDLRPRVEELRREGVRDMFSGAAFPERIVSANAYLGAFPIAAALDRGADIVITGRVVDSALALGALIHEFGWRPGDHQLLAAGTVAGHLLECSTQVAGGTFTDWRDVPDWANAGFPIGECHADGSLVVTKPPGTGGLVSVGTVAEQLLYEVSDPQRYFVPDVVCDFSAIRLEQLGPDRVRLSGARGYPPTASYKVCATYDDGWRSVALTPVIGIDAPLKAERQAEAILARARSLLRTRGLGDFRRTHVEILGCEAGYGARARIRGSREVICRIVVEHTDRRATDLFWREQNTAIMNMSVGTSIPLAIAAPPSIPVTALFSFLIDKSRVTATVTVGGHTQSVPVPTEGGFDTRLVAAPALPPEASVPPVAAAGGAAVPLIALAFARSGEKGDLFNIAVIARRPDYLPYIRRALTAAVLADWFRHFLAPAAAPRIEIFEVPGIHAINYLFYDSMSGGINSSPHLDCGAKGMAQQLLELPVAVPREVLDEITGVDHG